MPKIYGDLKGLTEALGDVIMDRVQKKAAPKISKYVSVKLENKVEETVYQAYEPKVYNRTNQLIDSITPVKGFKQGDKVVCGSVFDKDKLTEHTSLYPTVTPTKEVPLWSNAGWSWVSGTNAYTVGETKQPPRVPPNFVGKTFIEVASSKAIPNMIQKAVNSKYNVCDFYTHSYRKKTEDD